MFYGRSGTGKTTLAGSFPGKKLLLDIKDVGDDSLEGTPNIEVLDVTSWDEFEVAYWYLKKHPKEYDVLIIDTMSQLQQLAIRKVLTDEGKDADRAGDWGTMTKQMWGEVASLMKGWILHLRDLPMQVVFIAQDRVFNSGDDDDSSSDLAPEVGPGLSPSIAKTLNAAVHVVANTFIRCREIRVKVKKPEKGKPPYKFVEKIEFCLRVGPNPTFITKVRKAKAILLPEVIVDPSYDKIMAILSGVISEAQQQVSQEEV